MTDELAFLTTECDYLRAQWIGQRLFQTIEALLNDNPPPVLVDFYKSYRACVRAKVCALRADQLTGHDHEIASNEARQHMALADSYIQSWAHPLLIVVGGLSGTGKSTLATQIAHRLGCVSLQTDSIRQAMFGDGQTQDAFASGKYDRNSRQKVYAQLIQQAKALHEQGVSVVLDGTFSMAATLRDAYQIVNQRHAVFLAVECFCDKAIAKRRISRRLVAGSGSSEMRPEFMDEQSMRWEQWPAKLPKFRIDTKKPIEVQVSEFFEEIRPRFQLD